MGPVPLQAAAFSGRAYPWTSVGSPYRRHIHASVKQPVPMGGQVDTGTKSKTDPKDLLQDLKRLREQRARLRAELTSQEQKALAGQENSAQPRQSSINSDADPGNKSGPSAELGTSRQTAAPQDSAAQSEDTKASSQASELPKVTPAAAPAAASAAPASFLEFPAWQQKAVATSTEPPSEGSAAPPLSTQAPPQGQRRRKGRRQVEQAETPLDIVFVSAEVAPWSKTGGLGDVVGSLPIALAARGHRVMVVAPRYQNGTAVDELYSQAEDLGVRVPLDMGACGLQEVAYFHQHSDEVDFVFVDHPSYHRAGNPYQDSNGVFGDNQFRYALLSLAACEAPLQLHIGGYRTDEAPGFPYGDKVVFLANDWHAGLVPTYIAGKYRQHGVYKDARCIFAIHNLSHQGVDPAATFPNFGLPDTWYDPLSWEYPSWASINGPAVNILKGALLTSDRVVTVSEGYAWEITTPEGGWGLDKVLQSRQHILNGITNGIDLDEWDPEADEHTVAAYSAGDLSGKAACKEALQKELGLEVNPDIPLIGWIGRLDHQKGPDIVLDAVPGFAARSCQLIMLGSGHPQYEAAMRQREEDHPQHFRGWVGFSIPVAHRIVAGCDVMLVPSRFEPCGLNQLFAMRYGTIPIVHATGGLRDTVQDYNPDTLEERFKGTGWTFNPPSADAMLACVDRALETRWHNRKNWNALIGNGMTSDLSWDRAAKDYEQIFSWALMDPPQA
ncbi:hypothetical protein CVIRNUC_000923 [Coccomyxa viridis]|uniref:Starch synthase, chloroplastic/amyloplastic n=1 Tax=Coccomyxa viridis TaxID=1274662 RepID=A0AAV1HSV6_9CHLO|nr:hypothetical protein CVIRNUC_000923 [Coccomyxa viridis]